MKTVRLGGELGKRFGRLHRFAVKTPGEVVRALIANFPELKTFLEKSSEQNIAYRVTVDQTDIDETELQHPFSREILIMPEIMGAGNGVTKLIIGAVLIVAGVVLTTFTGGAAAAIGGYMINAGIGFMIGGVAQLLTPVPKAPEPKEDDANKTSYVFNGPVNTTAQGQPVPIGYGRLIVGGAVISAGITTEQLLPLYEDIVWIK